ncbi:Hydroxyacylglutathione hydrolase [Alloactinosynnema sp. L-07]|uniref:FAD/NAD(P)-binding protein n=1 Tax=Alloactinosynnema sp. L-07 TaxID=1653480 RepID=UPI00065F0244|nr:FAD/NAD(P)-binding protein [Alloactinosynnema sp. L-07]CRK56543.1 Hydroxyacylglutathione hydrolase [Alloactinosynnema sp. L-07]
MNQFGRSRRIVIVGAGLGGTATAIRLLQFAREPVQVVLLERRAEYRNAGAAYHRESNHWHHVFNIQAGRMSAFREDVDDFVTWANHEVDRTDWPAEWSGFTFTESGPAPRRIYSDYLADRLAQAAREALDGVSLVEADGDVVDLEVHTGHVDVVVENLAGAETDRVTLRADHVILATGLERKYPTFADNVVDHPSFVRDPYSETGIERIVGLRQDAVVAIVGTLLSAYDSAALLLRRGHTGKIHLISRSGLTLRTYPPDHRHDVLTLPPPRLGGDAYEGREEFVRRFKNEWKRACDLVAREHPDVSPAVVTERVSKSWEPYLPGILARIPTADLCALLDGYGSLLAVLRVGVMAYTAEIVEEAMAKDGQVAVIAGKVEEIHTTEAGGLAVSVSGPTSSQRVEADLVISNFGRESNYERVDSRLWANLLRKGIACSHRRTGRGVEVDRHGSLVGPTGVPSGRVSAVGSPREGDEIVRNGRTGAFTFNLAAIKNHTVQVAATVLCRLEACYDDAAAMSADASDPRLNGAISYATMLDVHRMTARRKDYRQAVITRLEGSLQAIQDITARDGGLPVTDRALRSVITAAAAAKLKDLSVTPRDLRSILGLERHLESIG